MVTQFVEDVLKRSEEFPGPDVNNRCQSVHTPTVWSEHPNHRQQQSWGQIINDIPVKIFEGVCCP